jgi:hypothetical protein
LRVLVGRLEHERRKVKVRVHAGIEYLRKYALAARDGVRHLRQRPQFQRVVVH